MPGTHEDLSPLGGLEEHRRKLSDDRKIGYDILRQTDEYKAVIAAADKGETTTLQGPSRTSEQTTTSADIQSSDFIGDRHSYLVQQRRKKWNDVDIKPYQLEKTKTLSYKAQSETGGGKLGENRLSEGTYTCLNSLPATSRLRWVIPDYEDILNQKRTQETNYRRANDSMYEKGLHVQEVSGSPSDTAPGHRQAAADGRNIPGYYPDHNLTFMEPCGRTPVVGGALDFHYGLPREPVSQISLDPPPGLYYQPATYVTDKSSSNPYSFVDEAYNFYASHNPLDPNLNAEASYVLGHTLHADSFMSAHLNDINPRSRCCLNIPGSGFMQVAFPSTGEDALGKWHLGSENKGKSSGDNLVIFPELSDHSSDKGHCLLANTRRHDRTHTTAAVGMEFPSDVEHKQHHLQLQAAYRGELDRQLLEKSGQSGQPADVQSRSEGTFTSQRDVDYGSFGRESNAELKDHQDSSKPDLCHMMHNVNKSQENIHLSNGHSSVSDAGCLGHTSIAERDHISDTASGDKTYGRGGYGIFGVPMTDAQKIQAEKYMADLKKQIEDKRSVEYRKRELERLEEEREQKILNEQRVQMQKEYEEDQRRVREKAEEAKLKNEEIMKAAEERKRETDRKDREEEKEREEKQEEIEILKERQKEEETRSRAKSPLIPTLRDKMDTYLDNVDKEELSLATTTAAAEAATASLSTNQNKQDNIEGTNTADVLTQLSRMRAFLLSEHKRLQAQLDTQNVSKIIHIRVTP